MAVRFPPAPTIDAFRALSRADPRVRAAAVALCRELGLAEPTPFEAGSLPVFAAGDHRVLKLFPPCFSRECGHERAVLARLAGALPIATPRPLAEGNADGWRWLVMERLPGAPLDAVWSSLAGPERLRLAAGVGGFLRALHAIDARDVASARIDWPRFVREQTDRCVEAQARRGLTAAWLEQIPSFLARAAMAPPDPGVLLHTEIMRAHVLAAHDGDGWSLSGVVDFEPAMIGAAEYEFASVGVFLTCGEGAALRALLRAYGYRDGDMDAPLQRRFLAHALLHRYSNLRWYLERLPPGGISTLDGLAARWWAIGDEPEIRPPR